MEDPNVIMIVRAMNPWTAEQFEKLHNRSRYKGPVFPEAASHETTPSLDNDDEEDDVPSHVQNNSSNYEKSNDQSFHRILLRFSDPAKDILNGFAFGSSRGKCDVYLGKGTESVHITGNHFYITFNEHGQVMLRDVSSGGMYVAYNGQGINKLRHKFTWVFLPEIQEITGRIGDKRDEGKLEFEFQIPPHHTCLVRYRANCNSYVSKMRAARRDAGQSSLDPFARLNMDSQQSSAVQTRPLSPRQGRWYFKGVELGRGSFGVVYQAVDVSTGSIYALKEFIKHGWEREVEIMKRVSHEYIIPFVDFTNEVTPQLVMEYRPLGSLPAQFLEKDPMTREQAVLLLYQGLKALEYLHSAGIAHRDIKPANILVESRVPLKIQLADFGLAKDQDTLNTCLGTFSYAAPEIWTKRPYTPAVDIWSLGVVAFEYAYGLPPKSYRMTQESWYRSVFKKVQTEVAKCSSDHLNNILSTNMLRRNPQERLPAGGCLKEMSRLGLAPIVGTPSVASTEELSPSFLMEAANKYDVSEGSNDDAETVILDNVPPLEQSLSDQPEPPTQILGSLWGAEATSDYNARGTGFRDSMHPSKVVKPKPLEIQSKSDKRQRSPFLSSRGRNKRRQSDIRGSVLRMYTLSDIDPGHDSESVPFGTLCEAVLALLTDINQEDSANRGEDERFGGLVESICEYARVLGITNIGLSQNDQSDLATVTACANSREFALARLTSSERMNPTADLAAHLLQMLQLQYATREAGQSMPTKALFPLFRESITRCTEDLGCRDYEGAEAQNTFAPWAPSEAATHISNPPADEGHKSKLKASRRLANRSGPTRQTAMDNISDRDQTRHPLISEDPEYVRMRFGEKYASIRKADSWLNATEILTVAGKGKNQTAHILRKLAKETTVEVQQPHAWFHRHSSWICYRRGHLLCQELQLIGKLGPLLEYGFEQRSSFDKLQEDKYLQVKTDTTPIFIRRTDLFINATHVLNACGYAQAYRKAFLGNFRKKKNLRPHQVKIQRSGPMNARGTYVDIPVALDLCETHGLHDAIELLQKTLQTNRSAAIPDPAHVLMSPSSVWLQTTFLASALFGNRSIRRCVS